LPIQNHGDNDWWEKYLEEENLIIPARRTGNLFGNPSKPAIDETRGGKVEIGLLPGETPAYTLDVNGTVNATKYLMNNLPLQSSQWNSELVARAFLFTSGNVALAAQRVLAIDYAW